MSIFNGNCGGGGGSAVAGAHASTHGTGGSDQLTPAMISAAPASHTHTPAQVGLPNAESTTNKNQPNGYAGLNASGQVPAALLPSYVDDIVEVANAAALPATGDASVVYVALDTSKAYRWGGSAYVEIAGSPGTTDSVVEGSVNLYFTAARAAAAQINADWNSASGKSQILNKPALGTAASKDVAATGNALAGQVVLGSDTRLSDPRTPVAHTHPQTEITGLVDALAPLASVPALARSSASALAALTGFAPSLFVDMLEASALTGGVPTGFTFTRASAGTCFGPDGLLRTVPAGELRHEWSPDTGEYLGALIEEGRTNLLLRSGAFDTAPWEAVGSVLFAPASGVAPDGTATAVEVTDNATVGDKGYIKQVVSVPTNSAQYAASVFLRAGTAGTTLIQLAFYDSTPAPLFYGVSLVWDENGVPELTPEANTDAVLLPVGGGWYRVSVLGENAGYANARVSLHPALGVGSVHAWGAQLEAGAAASSYIPTGAAAVASAADVLTRSTAGWLRQGSGTVLCEARLGAGLFPYAWGLLTDEDERIIYYRGNGYATPDTPHHLLITAGGATQAFMWLAASSGRFTAAYATNDVAALSDASPSLQTDDAATVPIVTTLGLGSSGAQFFANGHVRRFAYFPARLPNAVLQELTR